MFPANNLEKYFHELTDQSWTLIPVELAFASKLQNSAENKLKSRLFKSARIGRNLETNADIRTDRIFWLDAKNEMLTEVDLAALTCLERLRGELRNFFRISISEFECHFAVYEAGNFYKRHSDMAIASNKRVFSFVIYLNENWRPQDGGQLFAYETEKTLFQINPEAGQMILFKSDLEHEVTAAARTRYSLTGWFLR